MDILVVLEDLNGKIHRLSSEAIVGAQKLSASGRVEGAGIAVAQSSRTLRALRAAWRLTLDRGNHRSESEEGGDEARVMPRSARA